MKALRVLAVTNLYPTPGAPASGTFVEQQIKGLREAGVAVETLFVDRRGGGMGIYLQLPRRLRSSLDRYHPDLVHVMYGGIMAAQVTRIIKDRPVVVTYHGSDLLGERLSGRIRWLVAGVGVLASLRAARQASHVIVVSRNLETALSRRRPPAHLSVVPCGVDLQRFRPLDRVACQESLGWAANAFHVLFPANDGNQVKRPALARAAISELKRLGIPADLHMLRGVPHEEVPKWVNGSDVLLMTSLHEGSPMVVKEALACGVPIVSVDVGDVAEQIAGVEGCHIALPEPAALAAGMARVYDGPRRVAGRVRMADLSLERVAHRIVQIYHDALGRQALLHATVGPPANGVEKDRYE